MTEIDALWAAITMVVAMVGFFARYFIRKIDRVAEGQTDKQVAVLEAASLERVKSWERWRDEFESMCARRFKRIEDYLNGQLRE